VPFIYQAETRSLVPGAGTLQEHTMVATSDGRLGFVGVLEYPKRYAQPGELRLIVINADGSVPDGGVVRTLIHHERNKAHAASLALSPDEKTIYASDVRRINYRDLKYGRNVNKVLKFGWDDKTPEPFIAPPSADGNSKFNDPKGICTDKDGNVFICDKGNNRVAIFKPDGSFLGAMKVTSPERVAVHPKTGVVYVLGGAFISDVLKFASWKSGKPMAKAKLGICRHRDYRVTMVLEHTGEKPSLWFGSGRGHWCKPGPRTSFLRMEDNGASFGKAVNVRSLPANRGPGAGDVTTMSYNRQRDILHVGNRFFDVKAGKFTQQLGDRNAKYIGAFGLDGNFYGQKFPALVGRFGRDLKLLPFPKAKARNGQLVGPGGTMRLRGRGVTADAHGNVFNLWQRSVKECKGEWNMLYSYKPDGSLLKEKLIDADIRSLNSPRLDYQGNIYLALGLRPGKDRLPAGLKGKLPRDKKDPDAVGGLNSYPLIYGSIAKFGPEGGEIRKGNGGRECNYAYGTVTHVKGAKWIFSGASNVPSWRTPGTPDICLCESPRFDVDGFGRSFYPDAGRFRVGVLDTGGNEICTFGTYGNVDSAGQGSAVPVPDIPFHWPQAVAVGPDMVYVGDRLNHRVVCVKLGYAAEEVCPVP
jgi:hypothetical protein